MVSFRKVGGNLKIVRSVAGGLAKSDPFLNEVRYSEERFTCCSGFSELLLHDGPGKFGLSPWIGSSSGVIDRMRTPSIVAHIRAKSSASVWLSKSNSMSRSAMAS